MPLQPTAFQALPQWALVNHNADPNSGDPNETGAREKEVALIPYGATNLRAAAFPQVAR